MARLAGVDLPREKRAEIGLTYIFGIGRSRANMILKDAGVNPDTRIKDLTEAELQAIRDQLDHYQIEGDLRREVSMNIKRLRAVSYTHLDVYKRQVYKNRCSCIRSFPSTWNFR